MTFPLHPLQFRSLLQLAGVAVICLVFAGAAATFLTQFPVVSGLVAVSLLALASLFVWFGVGLSRATASLAGRRLTLSMPLYGRVMDVDRIEVTSLARIDLARDDRYTPTWRTNGLSVVGLNLGWFLTRGAGKSLIVATSSDALAWSTKDGYAVVVSVQDTDGLERAMRTALADAG